MGDVVCPDFAQLCSWRTCDTGSENIVILYFRSLVERLENAVYYDNLFIDSTLWFDFVFDV
jgi:hypothetical protein